MRNIINRRGEELLVIGSYEVNLQTIYLIECGGGGIAFGTYKDIMSFYFVSIDNHKMDIKSMIETLEMKISNRKKSLLEEKQHEIIKDGNREELKFFEAMVKDLKNWLSLKIEKMQEDGINRYYYEDENGECQEYISPELIELYKQNSIT